MNIFLIGFMGSGKSAVGEVLARILQFDFIDLDHFIELRREKSIATIFENEGEEKFRGYEQEALLEIAKKNNVVVACGGGTPCFHNNMEVIHKNGMSIYLLASIDTLLKNLGNNTAHRPLLKNKFGETLRSYIENTLVNRQSCYQQAQAVVMIDNKSVMEISEEIRKWIFPCKS